VLCFRAAAVRRVDRAVSKARAFCRFERQDRLEPPNQNVREAVSIPRCRRLFHKFLGENAVSRFENYLNKHTCRFLSRLAETPDDFLAHMQLLVLLRTAVSHVPHSLPMPSATGALIMEITYGMDIKSHEDKFLQAAERALNISEGP